jgi:hypothetical protein
MNAIAFEALNRPAGDIRHIVAQAMCHTVS